MDQARSYLGIDVGEARIGLAISDDRGTFALPLKTVDARNRERAARDIATICTDRDIITIVVGWPLTMEGREDRATRRVEIFLRGLQRALQAADLGELPIERFDERLTTVAAEAALSQTSLNSRRRRDHVDQVAATYILQAFLDTLQHRDNEDR